MRFEQLQYFLEITQSQSISIAAENLYISQSALSRSVKSLENELHVQLLFRTVDGVRLTKAGEELLPFIQELVDKSNNLIKIASEYDDTGCSNDYHQLKGHIKLVTAPIIADTIVFPALDLIKEIFPMLDIEIQLADFSDPLNIPFTSSTDLLIWTNIGDSLNTPLENMLNSNELQYEKLFVDGYSVVMSQNHPLARKRLISLEEALCHKLVTHYNGHNITMLCKLLIDLQKPLEILLNSNNSRIITNAIMKHNAILITNDLVVRSDFNNNSQLKVIPLKNYKATFFCLYDVHSIYANIISELIDIFKSIRLAF